MHLPKAAHQLTVLVCTPRIEGAPGFALLYLNASQNCVHILTLPAETAVPFGSGDATLADAYAAARRAASVGASFSAATRCSPVCRPLNVSSVGPKAPRRAAARASRRAL